jgi:hypothetical protein
VQAQAEALAGVAAAEAAVALVAAAVALAEHVNGIIIYKRERAIKVFSASNNKLYPSNAIIRKYGVSTKDADKDWLLPT